MTRKIDRKSNGGKRPSASAGRASLSAADLETVAGGVQITRKTDCASPKLILDGAGHTPN